uniref:Matrix metallopeptidase 20b (enamelysin) n=1 Tax=Labrus bergylta TaxID=56723 RepID=A0A3Q3FTH7_9LABR
IKKKMLSKTTSALLDFFSGQSNYYNLQKDPLGRMKRSGASFASKVKEMQVFFGLNTSGALDFDTLELMRSPRCGVPDVEEYSHIQGTRWNKNVITYSIGTYTRDMPRSAVDSLIDSAFSVWARASSLTFVRSHTSNVDIMVEFVTYEHGDLYPFDGPGGTLAHAFGPGLGVGGDTHFDDAEHWTAGETGFNLFVVAAHEFGHALGLKHSSNPESLMYPTYKSSCPASVLSSEDVANINALYGKQLYILIMTPVASHNNWLLNLGVNVKCFSTRYLWIKHNEQYDIKEGPITNFMPKIETNIDAVFWVPRRSTAYLIHGNSVLIIQCRSKHPLKVTLIPFLHRIKLIMTSDKCLYRAFFSYNENRRVMDFGYPKYISEDFPGVNTTINAAVHKDGFLFFFVGPEVYKYDYTQRHVVGVEKANSWLGCLNTVNP